MNDKYLKTICYMVEGTKTMAQFQEVSIEKVVRSTGINSRTNLGDLKDLAESIKAVGVKEPILVKDLENDKGDLEVFAGFRRLAASKLAKKETIPVLIYPKAEVTPKLAMVLNLTENVQREDLNPMDEANALMRLRTQHGMTDEDICAKVGIRKSRLDQRFRLLSMPEELQKALEEDKISMSAALEISKLPEGKHKRYIKLASELKGERLKKMVEKELEKIANKAERENGADSAGDEGKKEESSAYTELSRINRKHTSLLAKHFKFDEKMVDEVKSINWRAMELEDLKIVTNLFDTLVDILPNQVEFNDKAEQEIVELVEKGEKKLDLDSPIVRQALIKAIKARAEDMASEKVPQGKRPKVSYAVAKNAIDEFYGE